MGFSSSWKFADSKDRVSQVGLLERTVVSLLADAANSGRVFNDLSQRLIRLAEHAYSLRDMRSVQEVSELLLNLPIIEAQSIGQYYQALVNKRDGRADEAQARLERVADYAPLGYRARAMQTLGVIRHEQGHIDDALRFYKEASRATSSEQPSLLTNLLVNLQISVIKGSTGDHQGAIDYLRNLSPRVRLVANHQPLYFYFYHNALAVEFAEVGRIAEAEAACATALASPFAPAYPEWSETRDEIAAKRQSASRSVVAIHRAPEVEPATQRELQRKPKPLRALAFSCPASDKEFLQRSTLTIPARAVIAFNAVSILDRVLICIRPRAPPMLS
jgi:tetratricopeptide (TPR) repeat protein